MYRVENNVKVLGGCGLEVMEVGPPQWSGSTADERIRGRIQKGENGTVRK